VSLKLQHFLKHPEGVIRLTPLEATQHHYTGYSSTSLLSIYSQPSWLVEKRTWVARSYLGVVIEACSMASWLAGRGTSPPLSFPQNANIRDRGPYITLGKRRVSYSEGSDLPLEITGQAKRPRMHDDDCARLAEAQPVPVPLHYPTFPRNQAFIIIREQRSPSLPPEIENDVDSRCMERTASGISVSSDVSFPTTSSFDDSDRMNDDEAATQVTDHMAQFRRRSPDSRHERILRALIQPRSREAEFSIDNAALESIFYAANEIFFANELSKRVTWDWSHESSPQYDSHIIGTTALRRCKLGGYETLIVLSQPILKDRKYNRRLLISTFLHEMIHSYLFVTCGFKARHCGGHTQGFKQIAGLIDNWAGPDTLHLRDMEADLDHFREVTEDEDDGQRLLLRQQPRLQDCLFEYQPYYHPRPHHQLPAPQHRSHQLQDYYYQYNRWEYCIHDQWEGYSTNRSAPTAVASPYVF
jgi:hypothetical protein